MAGEDQAPVAAGVDAARVEVAGVGVGEIVAVPLGPADEVVRVAHVQRQAGPGVRAVEGDRDGGLLLAEQPPPLVPRVVEAGARPAVLRVEVVRLPGDVGQQEQQVGRMVVAHGEGDVRAVTVGGGQHGHVRADRPVARDLEPPGHPPVMAGDGPVGGERRRLDDAGEPGAGGDLGRAVAAVVADPVDVHGELLGRVHRDVEVDGLPGGGRAGRDEALDLPAHVIGGTGAAAAGAGEVGVPGDHLAGAVEVVLAAAQPRQRPLSEGVAHRVREGTRLPPANLLRPHAAPLPRTPGMDSTGGSPDNSGAPNVSAGPSTSHNARGSSPFVANWRERNRFFRSVPAYLSGVRGGARGSRAPSARHMRPSVRTAATAYAFTRRYGLRVAHRARRGGGGTAYARA